MLQYPGAGFLGEVLFCFGFLFLFGGGEGGKNLVPVAGGIQ